MKRFIKHYLISHKKNGYSPRLLAESGVAVLFIVIVALYGYTVLGPAIATNKPNSAAIYSGVLETLANTDRAQLALKPLTVNPLLEKAAQMKADDMAAKGYFAHYSPDGSAPWYWISKAGYNFLYAGENLAIDFTNSTEVNNAWLASTAHRDNILNVHYTDIGIAIATGRYQGRQTTFVVQMFGSQAAALSPALQAAQNAASQAAGTKIKVRPLIQSQPSSTQAAVLGAEIIPNQTQGLNNKNILGYVYLGLSIIILIALGSIIKKGIKKHNWRHIIYGSGLIILMAALFVIAAHTGTIVHIL